MTKIRGPNWTSALTRMLAARSRRHQHWRNVRTMHVAGATAAAIAGLMSLSCGYSHAILEIQAPPTVTAGVPFTATVTALFNGKPDTAINGPIHFTSSDKAAVLPTLYVFTPADAGSHTFNNLLLMTPGPQSMTVSDYDATPVAGTTNITVVGP